MYRTILLKKQIFYASLDTIAHNIRDHSGRTDFRNSLKKICSKVFLLLLIPISLPAQHAIHKKDQKHGAHTMHGMYGHYPMTREASGTSWVPDSSAVEGIHIMRHGWDFMFEGYSYLTFDHQGGPRGGKKFFDANMFMFMAHKDICKGILGFRSMLSLEPITIGKCGYPLLLQTGETCDGKTPLIDRQHPHDLFMELAVVFAYQFKQDSSFFIYFGLPGEPAIGPPIYMMRFSSEYIPETPITHHWADSTHITFGVGTLGYIWNNVKLEFSVFTGREPDENRFDIEAPRFDSHSLRLTWNPTENVSLSASYGFLKSPEQLEPNVNTRRYVLAGIYNRNWNSNNWQTTALVGINKNHPGHLLPGFLLESTLELKTKHMFFGRFEAVDKDELFVTPDPLADKIFNVKKLTGGYIYEFLWGKHLKWGIGGLMSGCMLPQPVADRYKNTFSYMVFLQTRLI